MPALLAAAKSLDPEFGKKLSVFWGNPEYDWGRLPVIDRLDLLDHGMAPLAGIRPAFRRARAARPPLARRRSGGEYHKKHWKPRERGGPPPPPELPPPPPRGPKDQKP